MVEKHVLADRMKNALEKWKGGRPQRLDSLKGCKVRVARQKRCHGGCSSGFCQNPLHHQDLA